MSDRPSEQPNDDPRGLGCTGIVMPQTPHDREIPRGVYWNAESGNFYAESDRKGCGMAFFLIWRDRSDEFPSCDGFGNHTA